VPPAPLAELWAIRHAEFERTITELEATGSTERDDGYLARSDELVQYIRINC